MFTECGDLGDDNNARQVDVVCPQPLVGRYVRVRASQFDERVEPPRLYMCEVFVIGYQFESRWLEVKQRIINTSTRIVWCY